MARGQRLTADDDGVYACPHCDNAGCLYARGTGNTHADDPDAPYYCEKCRSAVAEPVRREPKTNAVGLGAATAGSNAKYADLTPEDLGLE